MKHFLEISQLSLDEINRLLQRAMQFKREGHYPSLAGRHMANLFYENSTRTRSSFELAARHLSLSVLNLNLSASSESKGETLNDTIANLAAMGIDLFVLRHTQEGIQQELANTFAQQDIHFINAGDGRHAHPSQAMLDVMTILEHREDLSRLKIAIVGNIRHSRVANSLQCLFAQMGVGELRLIAPCIWQPETVHFGQTGDSLSDGIRDADVIICLRVQKERLAETEHLDLQSYHQQYALTQERLLLAKPDVMVMHPGPVNRGVEIDSEVADGPNSFILNQVTNGVFMRMAIIEALLT
ncbi:aspartate carbamoyltransferase catalytic subunit [Legionella sp. CNM-4043-24]|uniref:aspartate carbamoyltransferase catalytic subunit n=1 Tax=Legionella sp. CNM-4043-24 TaxID=3421646 RepID=UPI00403A8037